MALALSNLSLHRRSRKIFHDISFEIQAGEFVGLIGANGAGKTSLLRSALGLLDASGYSSLHSMTPFQRASHVAWLPQNREIAWPVSVERLIALGRMPHMSYGRSLMQDDRDKIERIIAYLNLGHLRKRTATLLSGGEQARVLIARALVQDTPLILADEPISGLDPAYQINTMRIFHQLAKQNNRAVLSSIHDLALAARFCTRLILISHGSIIADGIPEKVLTPPLMEQAFGISVFLKMTDMGLILQPMEVL